MQKVLVTGAAGFIGRRICETLIDKGYGVVAWDNFSDGLYSSRVKKLSASRLLEDWGLTILSQDLLDTDLVIPGDVEVVIHSAAMPGLAYSWENVPSYVENNQIATHNLVKAGLDSRIEKFVHISTSSVYGREAQGHENTPLRPASPYGITKLAAEFTLAAMSEALGPLNYSIVRLFSVYGPWQRPDMAFHKFIEAALENEPITIFGDGQQLRTNTYVDDAVDGIIRAMHFGKNNNIYNIGGGETVRLLDAVRTIENELGSKLALSFKEEVAGDQRITSANIAKASIELGYKPATSFRDGIKKQINWHQNQRFQ